MMHFVELPWALTLFIALPLLGFLIFGMEQRSRAVRLAKLGTRSMLVRLAPFGARLGMWRIVRLTGALALCGFAFAGPRWGIGGNIARTTGVDVVLALDASLSMMAPDAPPAANRLESLKNVVRQLHAMSPNDRFAIVAFAGHAFVLSPLTTDASAIDLYLDNLDPKTVGFAGTSMSDAIHQSTTLLSVHKGEGDRAIVVMSDGESFEPISDVVAEAKKAGGAGIALVTVGFGTEKGSTIPIRDSAGQPTFKTDLGGQQVVTHYIPAYLDGAAQSAHGVFIPASAPNKAQQIRHVLDGLKTSNRGAVNGSDLSLQFEWFVVPALLLLLIDTFLLLRPRRRRAVATAALAIGTMAAAACEPNRPKPSPIEAGHLLEYNRGTRLFGAQALSNHDSIVVHNDSLKMSAAELDSALDAKSSIVRYRAEFDSGWSRLVLAMRAKKLIKGPPEPVSTVATTPAPVAPPPPPPPSGDSTGADSTGTDSTASSDSTDSTAAKPQPPDTIAPMLAVARERYRAVLVSNPNDADARWNYELTLSTLKASGKNKKDNKKDKNGKKEDKKKGKENKKPGKKGPKKVPPKKGKTNQEPPIQRIKLPPQQAQQLLNAMAQREQLAAKASLKPALPPPLGKDW